MNARHAPTQTLAPVAPAPTVLRLATPTIPPPPTGWDPMLPGRPGWAAGVVPRPLWEKKTPADDRNRIQLTMRPLIVQAGSSEPGRELAAATAEAIFTAWTSLEEAQAFYSDVKGRLAKYGRRPEALVTADLRHVDGYAVKLRGVSTTDVAAQRN